MKFNGVRVYSGEKVNLAEWLSPINAGRGIDVIYKRYCNSDARAPCDRRAINE